MPGPNRPDAIRRRALALLGDGWSLRAIGRELDVHHTTVSWWRDGGGGGRERARLKRAARLVAWADGSERQRDGWAYLLGMYLGDGYIDPLGRLRIACDAKYPAIIDEIDTNLRRIGVLRPWHVRRGQSVEVISSPTGWADHLPTGRGPKHQYTLSWSLWHAEAIRTRPHLVLRGLIHSDGTRYVNRVTVRGRTSAYPSYAFSNRSQQVHRAFEACCALLGVHCGRATRGITRQVGRRPDVAFLDLFIGSKR